MGNTFGRNTKITIYGESHGNGIGAVLDNFPSGIELDIEAIKKEMARRRPGGELSTKRKEDDEFEILSGIYNGITTGAPISILIRNTNQNSKDYSKFYDIPRPSHSDYPAYVKFGGFNDIRGGGHFSARVTAPLVCTGGICKQALLKKGIKISAHIYSIKNIYDKKMTEFIDLSAKGLAVIDDFAGEKMAKLIEEARAGLDSVGGIIECGIFGMPTGIGDPFFDSIESMISHIIFSIPAVKGIEFGDGFSVSEKLGSENNDLYILENERVVTKTNHAGGINGGLSTGMPIIFRAAFKPTPSIYKEQTTLNIKTGVCEPLKIEGRHDPCVLVRAVPVVEAAAAIAIMNLI